MKHITAIAISVTILMTLSSASAASGLGNPLKDLSPGASRRSDVCEVVRVQDGDTFTCRELNGRRTIQIRMAEIDAPELSQSFGEASGSMLRSYILGHRVTVLPNGDEDRGRIIAHVMIEDVSINALMVKNGGAWVYAKYQKDPSLTRYQSFAKKNGLGLWASENPVPPWVYRRQGDSSYRYEDSDLFAKRGHTKIIGKDGLIHKALYGK